MAKILTGKVVATKMQNTVVVEVTSRVPHPLYKKLLKKSKHFNVDSASKTVAIGDEVRIVETKPVSKTKYFAIKEVITKK
jgi:small subunit ribosomal protein S17